MLISNSRYLGLIPVKNESGSSIKRPSGLSKTDHPVVRAKWYFAAISAAHHNPDTKALFERLVAKDKCKMSALGVVMRTLIHICFSVLKHQTPYSPKNV